MFPANNSGVESMPGAQLQLELSLALPVLRSIQLLVNMQVDHSGVGSEESTGVFLATKATSPRVEGKSLSKCFIHLPGK